MAVDNSREGYWREMQGRHQRQGGGGDGGDGSTPGLEARVARVESDIEHLKADSNRLVGDTSTIKASVSAVQVDIAKGIGEVKAVFATLEERSKHFTTKWDVVAMLAVLLGLIAAVMALIVRFVPPAG